MARGISRFADRDLRYGWQYYPKTQYYIWELPRVIMDIKVFRNNQTIVFPRGDFRIWLTGGGGGYATYTSITSSNTTGNFSGTFRSAAGAGGARCAFDVHIPNSLQYSAVLTIGNGGTSNTSGGNANGGGQTKVVIDKLGITATANGGGGGTTTSGGTTGACSITGTSFVAQTLQTKSEFVSRTSLSYNGVQSIFASSNGIDWSKITVDTFRRFALITGGSGGSGSVAVAINLQSTPDSYKVFANNPPSGWEWWQGTNSPGEKGSVAIERI